MTVFIVFLLFFCSFRECFGQTILEKMQTDLRITQFTKILQTYSSYFQNPSLCLLVPSDAAMSAVSMAAVNNEATVRRHIFNGNFFGDSKCVVAKWSTCTQYGTKANTEIVHGIESFSSMLFFSNLTGSPNVNGAKVLFPDNDYAGNKQVYHIIDQVLLEGTQDNFLVFLQNDPTLSISLKNWKSLKDASQRGALSEISKFQDNFITFDKDKTGTMLVPNDDAWNSLSAADQSSLNNMSVLNNVLARCYIPSRMIFVGNDTISFKAGFADNPKVDGPGNIDGKYYRDSRGGVMNVQNYFGVIVRPNIVIQGAVIHVINSPMFNLETRYTYLQRVAPAYYAEIAKDPYLSGLLGGNNTVLAIEDKTMVLVNQMDAKMKNLTLLNSFILGAATINNPKVNIIHTATNVTVRVVVVGTSIYLDTFSSDVDEKTYVNRAAVLSADNNIDGISISIVDGTVGAINQPCSYMLSKLQRRSYNLLVNSLGITLGLGSPYTLFVPNDAFLSVFTNSSLINTNNNTATSTTPSSVIVTMPSRSNISSSSTSSGSNSGGSNSGGSSSGANMESNSQTNIQYLLQRMIVANNLVLAKKSTGKFKAATMNYAAANEMLDMEINSGSSVSIGIYGVSYTIPSVDGGFYCYSNDSPLPERRNLIYPVDFLITTPKDSSLKVCVKTPCSGCLIKYLRSLVFVLSLVVYLIY